MKYTENSMADGGAGSLQQPLESPGATIAKLRIKLADLQEEMVEKKIAAGDVQELLLIGMLKTLDKLAPHDQISSLESAVRRMQRLIARHVPSEAKESEPTKIVGFKRKAKPDENHENALSDKSNEERQPESMKRRQRMLLEKDVKFKQIQPALRARVEAFTRFAVPYLRQCVAKPSASDLIEAYNKQLPADQANKLAADGTFFRHNLITKEMLAAATVDDALAGIGKGRPSYRGMSLTRCMELRPDYGVFLRWCMNWCVSRRGQKEKLTRTEMEDAWTSAVEYDGRINLTSLYTMGIVSAAKLNETMQAGGADAEAGGGAEAFRRFTRHVAREVPKPEIVA